MKKSEIIHIVKDPLLNAMTMLGKDKVPPQFASTVLASIIYNYDNGKIKDSEIKDHNNIFGIVDPSTDEPKSFDTIEDCIFFAMDNNWINLNPEDEVKGALESIAKANNLYRFDKEYLNSIGGNIIDVKDDKPNFDQYTVKDAHNENVIKTMNFQEAVKVAENVSAKPATILNSRGVIIKDEANPNRGKRTNVIRSSGKLVAGSLIKAENLNLYYKINDTAPGRSISGEFYLFDGKEIHGRYAICTMKNTEFNKNTVKSIIGFVNAKDIK